MSQVEKGWLNKSEINRVVFDSKVTDIKKLEQELKKSGTYIRTLSLSNK